MLRCKRGSTGAEEDADDGHPNEGGGGRCVSGGGGGGGGVFSWRTANGAVYGSNLNSSKKHAVVRCKTRGLP
jgi:hypothetical protein